jgi:hypothetical protein
MTKASRAYSGRTLKILFGQASHCAYPGCTEPLVLPPMGVADEEVLADICHIIAASDDGPRGDPHLPPEARNEPDNLLLMCPTHHKRVDRQHAAFPAALLRQWKSRHLREAGTNLGHYRAAIMRHLIGELQDAALFQRSTGAPPVEPRLRALTRDAIIARDLAEVAKQLDAPLVAVIGESGAGKTTLLHQIATRACEAPEAPALEDRCGALPLIVNCSRFAGSLPALIKAEARNSTGIAIDLDGLQGSDFPLNLYCDDFQYCADKKGFLEQLRAFTHQYNQARCLLLSHELPDHAVLERFGFSTFLLADLDDDGLLDLFRGFMDEEAAEGLLDELAARGELEAFRKPMLATLVAVAQVDQPLDVRTQQTSLKRGELLRRVVRDGVLTAWVSSRSPDLASPPAEALVAVLAAVAAELVLADKETLPAAELTTFRGDSAAPALEIGVSCGLLRRQAGEVGFAHAAIRDYFAAEWLLHAPPRRVAAAWFSSRWHGAIKNFASLWEPDPRRLFWLRLCGWASLKLISGLRIAPQSFPTRLFYLMLEFAADARIDEPWLQLGIFEHYRSGRTFLDESTNKPHRAFIGPWDDKLAQVYRLFGQLHHPDIDQWLRTAAQRRYGIHGISQDKSEAGLETLLRGVGSDDDGLADDVAIELAFDYPKAMLRRVFDRLLVDHEVTAHILLWRISMACERRRVYPRDGGSRHEHRRNRVGTILSTDDYWRDRMLGLLLEDEDDRVAEGATRVLRCLGSLLREDVEASLVCALRSGNTLARRRAVWVLVYGGGDESLEALLQSVSEDPDVVVSAIAADALLYRDTLNAPDHYVTLLRRFGRVDAGLCKIWRRPIARTVSAYAADEGRRRYRRQVRSFLLFLHCGEAAFERTVAAYGMDRFRGRIIADAMHAALESEADESVRNCLARLWSRKEEVPVDEAIRYLLSTSTPNLRRRVADVVEQRSVEPSAEVKELIRSAAAEEQDPQVRDKLEDALRSLKVREELRRPAAADA